MADLTKGFETDSRGLPLSSYLALRRSTEMHKFGEIHGRFGAHK